MVAGYLFQVMRAPDVRVFRVLLLSLETFGEALALALLGLA